MSIEKPPRRWFAFSLRTMFVVLTIFACWLGWEFHAVHERQSMLKWIAEHHGHVNSYDAHQLWEDIAKPEILENRRRFPEMRRLFGDEPIALVVFEEDNPIDEHETERISALFPEALFTGIVPAPPVATRQAD